MKASGALRHLQEGKIATKCHYNTEPTTSSKTISPNSFRLDLNLCVVFGFIDFIQWSVVHWFVFDGVGVGFPAGETSGQTLAAVLRGDDSENSTKKVSFHGGLWCDVSEVPWIHKSPKTIYTCSGNVLFADWICINRCTKMIWSTEVWMEKSNAQTLMAKDSMFKKCRLSTCAPYKVCLLMPYWWTDKHPGFLIDCIDYKKLLWALQRA